MDEDRSGQGVRGPAGVVAAVHGGSPGQHEPGGEESFAPFRRERDGALGRLQRDGLVVVEPSEAGLGAHDVGTPPEGAGQRQSAPLPDVHLWRSGNLGSSGCLNTHKDGHNLKRSQKEEETEKEGSGHSLWT